MRSFMFDILQGDMTRSKVILTFTCLKMYIARSGDTSGSRTTLCFVFMLLLLYFLYFDIFSVFLCVFFEIHVLPPWFLFCFLYRRKLGTLVYISSLLLTAFLLISLLLSSSPPAIVSSPTLSRSLLSSSASLVPEAQGWYSVRILRQILSYFTNRYSVTCS